MPYVERDAAGTISGLYVWPQPGRAEEFLSDDDSEVMSFLVPPPSAEDVQRECARRLALGFDYDFGDERGVHHFATTEKDMKGWDDVSKIAQAAINVGAPETIIHISTETGACAVTALEWQSVLLAAGEVQQPIWQASFVLQAMDPIPADYSDDSYWD